MKVPSTDAHRQNDGDETQSLSDEGKRRGDRNHATPGSSTKSSSDGEEQRRKDDSPAKTLNMSEEQYHAYWKDLSEDLSEVHLLLDERFQPSHGPCSDLLALLLAFWCVLDQGYY